MRGQSLETRFWSKVDCSPGQGPNGDCLFWIGSIVSGYGQIMCEGVVEYAHRVAYQMKHGIRLVRVRDGGPLVCHTCDQRRCINDEHLFLGTNTDNMQDMIRKGRQVIRDNRGEANPLSKLKPGQVIAIRADGRSYSKIADDFAIAVSTVCQIKHRKLWPHLTEEVLTT